jgi:DNA-binding CsgD family transcriptional regulator
LRSDRRGPFDDDDAARLELLLPHLQQAFRLHNLLQAATTHHRTVRGLLERFAGPAAILNRDSRIQDLNAALETLIRANGPVLRTGARLLARRPSAARALAQAVHQAATTSPLSSGDAGIRLRLEEDLDDETDADGCAAAASRRPRALWIATVWPLTAATAAGLTVGGSGALVTLTDLARPRRVEPTLLQNLLGLSPAEARLVAALAQGESLNDVVARTGVSPNTVRSQLKIVFAKLDVSSQVELARLVDGLGQSASGR